MYRVSLALLGYGVQGISRYSTLVANPKTLNHNPETLILTLRPEPDL